MIFGPKNDGCGANDQDPRAGQGDFLFVARMRAASVVAIIEAIRRLR